VGEPGTAAATLAPGVKGRAWRRKADIRTTAGLLREHARLIARIENDRISLNKAEVLGRAYSRQREMVTDHEMTSARRRLLEQYIAANQDRLSVEDMSMLVREMGDGQEGKS
jgi:hypothetical protein